MKFFKTFEQHDVWIEYEDEFVKKLDVSDIDFAEDFIKYLEKEMSWNHAKVHEITKKEIDVWKDLFEPGVVKDGQFVYDCMAGQSVSKELIEAATKAGLTIKVSIGSKVNHLGTVSQKDWRHDYLITVKNYVEKNPKFNKLKSASDLGVLDKN